MNIDLRRAEPGLPDDVGYRRSGNLRTISESLNSRTIRDTAAHSGLLRCNNQWSGKNTFAVRWRFCSAENEQARVAGSISRRRKLSSRQLHPQCSSELACDKSQRNK